MELFNKSLHRRLMVGAMLISATVMLPTENASAQNSWPHQVGGGEVVKTLMASNGDVIVAGHFTGETTLGGRTIASAGMQDGYVARISQTGAVVWVSTIGGVLKDEITDIIVDPSNNVYVSGSFNRKVFVNGATAVEEGAGDQTQAGFVLRLNNATGVLSWAGGLKELDYETSATSLAFYPGDETVFPQIPDSILISGYYGGSPTFSVGSSSKTFQNKTLESAYLVRLDTDGQTWRGGWFSSSGEERATHIGLDTNGVAHVGLAGYDNEGIFHTVFDANFSFGQTWKKTSPSGARAYLQTTAQANLIKSSASVQPSTAPHLVLRHGGSSASVETVHSLDMRESYPSVKIELTPGFNKSDGAVRISETPDYNEPLYFEYYGSDGRWVVIETFNPGIGGVQSGRALVREVDINSPNARHAGFKLRLRMGAASGDDFDYWHISSVTVSKRYLGQSSLIPISSLRSNTFSAGVRSRLDGMQLKGVSISNSLPSSGVSVALVANYRNGLNNPQSMCRDASVSGEGGVLASISYLAGSYSCIWTRALSGVDLNGVAQDAGSYYVVGTFTGELSLPTQGGPTTIKSNDVSKDVFVTSLDKQSSNWRWLTGGNAEGVGNPPAPIGGSGEDKGLSIAAGLGQLYLGGSFSDTSQFGPVDYLAAKNGKDSFLFKLGSDGRFLQPETWPVGVAITPPAGAITSSYTLQPEFYLDGVRVEALGAELRWFIWSRGSSEFKLVPLQATPGLEIHWRTDEDLTSNSRIVTQGAAAWPIKQCGDLDIPGNPNIEPCYQAHVIGAPVEVKPQGYEIFGDVVNSTRGGSNARIDAGVFNSTISGYASIIYVHGPTLDTQIYPTYVEVVRSMPYAQTPDFRDAVSVEIGKKIINSYHNELGRSGWVINELAYYDGTGVNAAYNRSARTGSIIPVNRYSSRRTQDSGRELAVAWYRKSGKGVYWPSQAVRYAPRWPYDPARIVIASEQGSEVFGQPVITASAYPQAHIYIQNDFTAPGFNPNDEHALMAPSSQGSGYDAVFALRSDFGNESDAAAASDPYVLLKYYDNANSDWAFRVYKVLATGAGFNRFRYTGTAGTTVSPPYPVRLLPGCSNTFVEGQATGEPAPAPFFQDHKNQLWAKSAGIGKVHYYYPMQPGFYQDNNNDEITDYAIGQCTPWMARLPLSEGGSDNGTTPIAVEYSLSWPENPPLLIAGETLLTPKRGLPDIKNQAAVEIVYDDIRDVRPNAGPADTLAQLIDPLSPRWVRLSSMPSSIATKMRTDGFYDIKGSADGTLKLPASLAERLYWDAMNNRLVFKGVFDETGAGDPKLLLNVMSKRERVILKRLNGGTGNEGEGTLPDCVSSAGCDWDRAVEALYVLTRNPNGIEKICTNSSIGENRERICNQVNQELTGDELLTAYTDPANNGILQPLSVLGQGAALTAGAAQGDGYMTIAFNNDPSLGALPVSLEVIRVGCLTSTNPSIFAPYQGQINVISPDDIFDEQLVLRHGGDFGGNPDALQFEWFYHPDANGTPPSPLPTPENGQMHGWIQVPLANPNGAVEISIEGANIQTLSDNWYLARYRGLSACNNNSTWSLWAGQPGSTPVTPRAQLAEGWVKRVLARLNPFEARVQDFGSAATNHYASMLIQLGERYSGPVALNSDPNNLNQMGLIEAYTTVMRRAMQLSVDSTPPIDYGPANAAVLLVASRLVDFYTLLANEAYADAQDPTIGIDSGSDTINLNPSIFTFQNQLTSPLDEELVLLRGRDNSHGPVAASPVYNRLFWNFSRGDGEVAYALSYNISDQNVDGVIDEYDARIMFPQGHGDAWGHYLTASKTYYDLLRHPYFSWNPQSEAVLIAGVPINVDYLDERQFAETAAAKARTGSEIVNLTYRQAYVEDPNGQWQGYDDSNESRAWGLSEWGRRAGMAAYFDWLTVNAVLPEVDDNPDHVGIQRIERSNINELSEISGHYATIQQQIDKADAGLNPLGLAKNVVPFDIDPFQLQYFNKTQFEQVWERALGALNNALRLWEHANLLNNQLRRIQVDADALTTVSAQQEVSFANQLIEIFGYPYADDIGPGGTYPAGYNGADIYNYMYLDVPVLSGTYLDFGSHDVCQDDEDIGAGECDGLDPDGFLNMEDPSLNVLKYSRFDGYVDQGPNAIGFFNVNPSQSLGGEYIEPDCELYPMGVGCPLGDAADIDALAIQRVMIESPAFGKWFTKPPEWSGDRRAPGRIQQILHQMLMARIDLKKAEVEYERLRLDVEAEIAGVRAVFNTQTANINLANDLSNQLRSMTAAVESMKSGAIAARRVGEWLDTSFKTTAECIPKSLVAGLAVGGDPFSGPRCTVIASGSIGKSVLDTVADGMDIIGNAVDASKENVSSLSSIKTMINDLNLEMINVTGNVDTLMRQEPVLRAEIFARAEAIKQLHGDYLSALAEGIRVYDQLVTFRKTGAAATQQHRYKDMAFRIFRNDALQKYRASFDLAARYVYMAAAAYDYETNLLGRDAKAGQVFLTNVVKQRSLGQVLAGQPMAGSPGLADTMAQLKLNFDVLKGQMGFNNPQVETNRFSLRRELFRIPEGTEGDEQWRAMLEEARVADLWHLPEYRSLARPFAPQSAGPQPGLVFEFSTNVTFGLNFFGWDLGPQDSSYDSSRFATRIRSVGTWFANYAGLPLADDPNVYLIPAGEDILRSPDPLSFETRSWNVMDQAVPIPFPVGAQDIARFDWNPNDTLGESRVAVRRYPQMRAHHFAEPFNDSEVTTDSRLVGRSVWNRRWILIIPGGTFLSNPNEGLDTFIHGTRIPGGGTERDGNGVSDIRVFFKTYSYSGN